MRVVRKAIGGAVALEGERGEVDELAPFCSSSSASAARPAVLTVAAPPAARPAPPAVARSSALPHNSFSGAGRGRAWGPVGFEPPSTEEARSHKVETLPARQEESGCTRRIAAPMGPLGAVRAQRLSKIAT